MERMAHDVRANASDTLDAYGFALMQRSGGSSRASTSFELSVIFAQLLVATLNAASDPQHVGREKHIGAHDLVDDRARFLETCVARHWQFDEPRRAAYSTMMLLAVLGGAPEL